MFGIEKFDERYQPLFMIGSIVIVLSVFLFGLFLFTTVIQLEISKRANPAGQRARYYEGVILVEIKIGISKAGAQNLFSNLGLRYRPPITKEDGSLEYVVEVARGEELVWISRLKKQTNKVSDARLIEARYGEEL